MNERNMGKTWLVDSAFHLHVCYLSCVLVVAMTKMVGMCKGCGEKKPLFKGQGSNAWCKDCAHLAPPSTELSNKEPKEDRIRNRMPLIERPSEYKGTTQDE